MTDLSRRKLLILSALLGGLALLSTLPARADRQVDRLVLLALEGKNHRVRSEAVYSLGKFDAAESREALIMALLDDHEAVRVAALASLAKVGDAETVEVLRAVEEKNGVVRNQLRRTLVLLQERFPKTRRPVVWKQMRAAIEIGTVADKTPAPSQKRIVEIRRYLSRHLRMQEGVAVIEAPKTLDTFEKPLRRNKVKPVYALVSLTELERVRVGGETGWQAKLSVAVLTYPQKNLKGMMNNTGVTRRSNRYYKPEHDPVMQLRAVEGAAEAAAQSIVEQIDKL
jgi:hypothetical protein